MKLSQDDLLTRIQKRVTKLADEAFNEEAAVDSDGLDQAERDGLMMALAVVEDEFRSHKVVTA